MEKKLNYKNQSTILKESIIKIFNFRLFATDPFGTFGKKPNVPQILEKGE